jgi:hypothetical protein
VLVNFSAVANVNGNVDISGGVTRPTELFVMLSPHHIPGYHAMASNFAGGIFPASIGHQHVTRMEFTEAGPFDFFEFGFPGADFHYLYVFFGNSETGEFSPVRLFVLPVI